VAAVIVENTFTSIPDMIDVVRDAPHAMYAAAPCLWLTGWFGLAQVLSWLSPFKFLSRNKWSSKDVVGQLTIPILLLSGEKDELVPARMMQQLYERSTGSLKRHIIYFADGFVSTSASFLLSSSSSSPSSPSPALSQCMRIDLLFLVGLYQQDTHGHVHAAWLLQEGEGMAQDRVRRGHT
jgi:fermentation-respiration switch protein FrsA (DUF1100 family)